MQQKYDDSLDFTNTAYKSMYKFEGESVKKVTVVAKKVCNLY